jgi:hypothetical protein
MIVFLIRSGAARRVGQQTSTLAIGGALLPLYANFAPDIDLFLTSDK